MVNLSLLLGSGDTGTDVLHKIPWLRYLDKEKHQIYISSRIELSTHTNDKFKDLVGDSSFLELKNSIEDLIKTASGVSFLYDSPFIKKQYNLENIKNLQFWLGISFDYISSFDRRFYDKEKLVDIRNKNKLLNYLAGLTEYFREFFIKNKITVFINTMEDDAFSVVAYYVARKLNITIIGFVGSRFPRTGFNFCKDFRDVCEWNNDEVDWNDILSLYEDSTISQKHTMEQNIDYWSLQSIKKRFKGLFSVIKYKYYVDEVVNTYYQEKYIFDPRITILNEIKEYFIKAARILLNGKLLRNPNYDEKYFIFPLHYTEDSQLTFAEPLTDQFKLIHDISRALPTGYYLYVKPHPHYLMTDLNSFKMNKLNKLKNVKIINPKTPNIKLIKNSSGVITINSTTGFEALILGIPVITLGHDFYCKEELCFVVRDLTDLSHIIMDSLTIRKDNTKIKDFVNNFYNNTIFVDMIFHDYGFFGLTDSGGKKIANALNKILEKEKCN